MQVSILTYCQVLSTPSVALEPINYGDSFSSITSQFCAENNMDVEETMHYTEMLPKRVEQLEYRALERMYRFISYSVNWDSWIMRTNRSSLNVSQLSGFYCIKIRVV
uniref:Uncharacterized protein n=1 Tax=Schizaphis graminum TaxID=13262 RepID=A0A2S2PU51_SCHGA